MGSQEVPPTANGHTDDLNFLEKLLQSVSNLNTFTKEVFSHDFTADVATIDPRALKAGLIGDLASQVDRIPEDLQTAFELLAAKHNHGLVDDKKMTVEKLIQGLASLPADSPALQKLSGTFVEKLWTGLTHPPLSYVGDDYRYRTPDGSNNNKTMPWLGKARSTYARTVDPQTVLPPTLPDPSLIFDEVMARGPKAREHPNKVSSMLFYLATIIIHDIFRTNRKNWTQVENSSYLDLSPLYGNDETTQRSVRTMKDGKLKPDAFVEERLLGFPPGVAAFMCTFNRFHNWVAGQLAEINEGGRFTPMSDFDWNMSHYKADLKTEEGRQAQNLFKTFATPEDKRDHDLFNTARLVTCGLYINIILGDYVRTILNLNTTHSSWILDPRQDSGKIYGPSGVPEGVGNQVSVEFNLVYRWHSTISEKDEKWSKEFYSRLVKDEKKDQLEDLTLKDFQEALGKFKSEIHPDPGQRVFAGLVRQADGSFNSNDLVNILADATEDCGGAFGARNVPAIMKAIEIMGMEQARKWNVATLNEFRQFFGMQPHKTFTDITSQPEVAASLKTLYGSPDFVELYPGLVAEDGKPVMEPGSGLCPGYTISKAILSDATALVRGDRFYTLDYNAATLTNWGYNLTKSNPQIAGGGVMYKLLHHAFPGCYLGNSVYAMYPFQTPEKTKSNLQNLGQVNDFSFARPRFVGLPPNVQTWKAVVDILNDTERFKVPWGHNIKDATGGHDYMLGGDTKWHFQQHAYVGKALYPSTEWKQDIKSMYEEITMNLLKTNSHKLRNGYQLDVVKDLANPSHALATGQLFHIPLKTTNDPVGFLTPQQYYTLMSVLFAYVFLNADDSKAFELRQGALQATAAISKITAGVVDLVQASAFHKLAHWFLQATGWRPKEEHLENSFGTKLIQRMIGGPDGNSSEDVTPAIVCTMAASVCTQAQGLSQSLDLLMQDKYCHHWEEIQKLARSDAEADFEKLEKYALECLRLATPAFGLLRIVDTDSVTIKDGAYGDITLKKGDQVFVNFIKCALDPDVFPNPHEIDITRDPKLYIHHGYGPHACLGRNIVTTALAVQLKCIAKCKNLRRAPGPQGEMKYTMVNGMFKVYMKEDWSDNWPFPTTMKFIHDGLEA